MTTKTWQAVGGGLGAAGLVLICLAVTLPPLRLWIANQWQTLTISNNSAHQSPTPIPTPTPDPLAPVSIALLGYGGGTHEGGKLTDSIIVAQIHPKDSQVILMSVPRDLFVDLPVSSDSSKAFKINAAYALGSDTKQYLQRPAQYQGEHGGGTLAKTTLSQVLGFPIHYYVAVSFASFETNVDALGGVDVEVPFSFTDEFYPVAGKEKETCEKSETDIAALTATMSGYKLEQQFPCRYETITFTKGRAHMDGPTALKFVRSRHSSINGSDFGRGLRQQAFVKALKQKVFSISFLPKLIPLIEKNRESLTTDLTPGVIATWLSIFSNPADFTITSLALTDQNVLKSSVSSDKQYILVPKTGEQWSLVQEFVASSTAALINPTSAPAAVSASPTTTPSAESSL